MLHLTFIFLEEDHILNMAVIIISWRRQPKKRFFFAVAPEDWGENTEVRKITLTEDNCPRNSTNL